MIGTRRIAFWLVKSLIGKSIVHCLPRGCESVGLKCCGVWFKVLLAALWYGGIFSPTEVSEIATDMTLLEYKAYDIGVRNRKSCVSSERSKSSAKPTLVGITSSSASAMGFVGSCSSTEGVSENRRSSRGESGRVVDVYGVHVCTLFSSRSESECAARRYLNSPYV